MAKKEYREVPVDELTEEELKRWFQRLRELYKGEQYHVHEIKVERGKLRVENEKLRKEIRLLTKENKMLKEWWEVRTPKRVSSKVEMVDFKKKFFDSL